MTSRDLHEDVPDAPSDASPDAPSGESWLRLSIRTVWVDLALLVLSAAPAVISLLVLGAAAQASLWPVLGLAVAGVIGSGADALRWAFTRYRITPTHIERKTGVLKRVHRSIQRDRVRSVDAEAKLRHRVAGLRVVKVGAGQQAAAGESALALDAVSTADARALRNLLLRPVTAPDAPEPDEPDERPHDAPAATDADAPIAVFARFEPGWVVYNMFNFWGYVLAAGLAWGGTWLLSSVGVDAVGMVSGLLDWEALGRPLTIVIAFAALTVAGTIGLTVTYFTEYWNFELARVRGKDGTLLRTRRGLFTTREVNRNENRIRGMQISEPVLWRWMRICDTRVITTGLSVWAMSEPTSILARGPVRVARRVTGQVLGTAENPLRAALAPHPPAALRRRLTWATAGTAVLGLVLAWPAVTGVLPAAAVWAAAGVWPLALGAAVIAHRALGHTIAGPYLVTRSGLVNRSTTALQRSAVSTIVIRESLLQRRLGLRTVSAMTAAGYGGYDTPDIERDAGLAFAAQAAPGLLDPFLTRGDGEET